MRFKTLFFNFWRELLTINPSALWASPLIRETFFWRLFKNAKEESPPY